MGGEVSGGVGLLDADGFVLGGGGGWAGRCWTSSSRWAVGWAGWGVKSGGGVGLLDADGFCFGWGGGGLGWEVLDILKPLGCGLGWVGGEVGGGLDADGFLFWVGGWAGLGGVGHPQAAGLWAGLGGG